MALAGSTPRAHGKPWPRWAGETLAQVAIAPQSVASIAPGTLRAWLRAEKSNPGR